ncbi:hypothetical protein ACLB2K_044745 [Fragaria x ananassa]
MAITHVLVFLVNLIALLFSVIINPSGAVFLSIDCGFNGSSTYKHKNSILWSGDDAYINNKHESQALQYMDTEDDWSTSIRIFPTLKKNCYTIPVDKAGQRILVRASFYHWGFYDNKTSPTFELQFDGTYWATVNKPNIASYEAIYIAKQNTTSICLAQVEDDQIPFISALEIRSLHFNMYSHINPNYALLLANRIYDGANQTLRKLMIPPLINAYEVYSIAGPLAQGTKTKDVEGLTALQRGFDVLEKWSGDPCLPSSFAWERVQCNAVLRYCKNIKISRNLGSFGLSGTLPDFSSMDALQTIDLHNNSLDGAIPDFLGSILNLKLLDLSDNRLNGSIPSSLSDNKNLKLVQYKRKLSLGNVLFAGFWISTTLTRTTNTCFRWS